jgi:Zn-dependent protease with chaperone function
MKNSISLISLLLLSSVPVQILGQSTYTYSDNYTLDARMIAEELGDMDINKINVYTSSTEPAYAYKYDVTLNSNDILNDPDKTRFILAHEIAHVKYDFSKAFFLSHFIIGISSYVFGVMIVPKIISSINQKFFNIQIDKNNEKLIIFSRIICGWITGMLCLNLHLKYIEYKADSTAITYLINKQDKAALLSCANHFYGSHNKKMSHNPLLRFVNDYCGTSATDVFDTMISAITCNFYNYFNAHPNPLSRAIRLQKAAESIKSQGPVYWNIARPAIDFESLL